MKISKPIASAAAAAVLVVLLSSHMRSDDAAPKPATEPDFFAFVRPTVSAAPGAGDALIVKPELKQLFDEHLAGSEQKPIEAMRVVSVEQAVQKMRAQGAGENEIYRLRASALAADAVARLSAMEQGEREWKSRIDAYLAERDHLLRSSDKAAQTDHAAALQQLREARFTPEEQARLAAYTQPTTPQLLQH